MADKVEVYVRKEKKLPREYVSTPFSDGVMTCSSLSKKMLEYEKALQEADKWALELANLFEVKRDLQVEVIDVSSLKGKLKATERGISKTPTTAIGQERIEAPSNMERLKEKLKSYFKQANP
ncbi:MAG: hypothetical protein WCD81_06420 [Candidatus Bathyarchaeia archaeon]